MAPVAGQEDDRGVTDGSVRAVAQFLEKCQTVHGPHFDVAKHDIGLNAGHCLQAGLTVGGGLNLTEADLFHHLADDVHHELLVVDD